MFYRTLIRYAIKVYGRYFFCIPGLSTRILVGLDSEDLPSFVLENILRNDLEDVYFIAECDFCSDPEYIQLKNWELAPEPVDIDL